MTTMLDYKATMTCVRVKNTHCQRTMPDFLATDLGNFAKTKDMEIILSKILAKDCAVRELLPTSVTSEI